jgi:hypothetical protein
MHIQLEPSRGGDRIQRNEVQCSSYVEGTTVAAVLERTSGGTSGTVDVLVSFHTNGGRANVQAGVQIVTFLVGARSATLEIPLTTANTHEAGL